MLRRFCTKSRPQKTGFCEKLVRSCSGKNLEVAAADKLFRLVIEVRMTTEKRRVRRFTASAGLPGKRFHFCSYGLKALQHSLNG